MPPETRYVRSGDVHIAYQVTGTGPDLVLVPGWVSHLEYFWEEATFAHFLERLASFSRLILLDRRGTGLSDRAAELPSLEQRMGDLQAVLDAAGSERAALFGVSEGGPMCALFAARHPERTSALILYGTWARGYAAPGYPWGRDPAAVKRLMDALVPEWGTGAVSEFLAPSLGRDAVRKQAWGRIERLAVSPGGARTLIEMALDSDVRDVLPAVRAPTLVLNRAGDLLTGMEEARYIATRIPGARLVELAGDDHMPWIGDANAILDEVEEFVTGARPAGEPERVLATVLFTDIVDSSGRATALGDRRWRELLDAFHTAVRREVVRSGGREIDTAGDGFFAAFDVPARALRCASTVQDAAAALGLQLRTGVHTGECEVIGEKLGGIAVHIGARVASSAAPGEVLVSSTVRDLVTGSDVRFVDRGVHELRGIPGEWRLFAVDQGGRGARTAGRASSTEPRARFATSRDGVRIAYWTLGEGAPLVYMPRLPASHIQLEWEIPEMRRWYTGLARRRQLIRYDGRGTGLSDRDIHEYTADTVATDLDAVVDQLGLRRFALYANMPILPAALTYAARHPDRVARLVLWAPAARNGVVNTPEFEMIRAMADRDWNLFSEGSAHVMLGWTEGDSANRFATLTREAVTQATARLLLEGSDGFDATPVLSQVTAPALLLHRRDVRWWPFDVVRTLAAALPQATLISLEGTSMAPFLGDTAAVLRAIDEFLGG